MKAITPYFGSLWVVIPVMGILSFVVVYNYAEQIIEFLKKQSLGNREYVIKRLDLMFVDINKRRVTGAMLMVSFGMGLLVFAILWPNIILGLAVGSVLTIVGWGIPKRVIDMYYNRRAGQFVDQMVDGLTL